MSKAKEPTGDLAALGFSGRMYPESEEEPSGIEASEEVAAPEEESAESHLLEEGEVEAADSESEEEEPSPLALAYERLAKEQESYAPKEDDNITRLQQKVSYLTEQLERLQSRDAEALAKEPTSKKDSSEEVGDLLSNENILKLIDYYEDRDPRTAQLMRAKLTVEQARRDMKAELKKFRDEFSQQNQQQNWQQIENQARDALHQELARISEQYGGLHAEVIKDFYDRRHNSLLYDRMQRNGPAMLTENGVSDMVSGLVTDLRREAQTGVAPSRPHKATSSGTGSPSRKYVDTVKPKQKPSRDYGDELLGLATPTGKLKKLLGQ